MKLQAQISRKYQGKEYEKFWVVVPHKILETLGWKAGDELKSEAKGNKLVIQKD